LTITNIALYSGWGPEARRRNPGDELCHLGAVKLLEEQGLTQLIDVRRSIHPILNPWNGDLIIGGGTVLPAVFEPWVGPGLKCARRKYVFGSGCLSPDELSRKGIVEFDQNAYRDVHVVGVRGPSSTLYFRQYFGRTVNFIGDLAFAFAQDQPSPPSSPNAVFFVIESSSPASRLGSTLHDVVGVCTSLISSGMLDSFKSTLCTTGDGFELFHQTDLSRIFDDHVDLPSSYSLVSEIKSSSFVVTERLHPAIIAICLGKPFIYIQTTSKAYDLQSLLCAISPHHISEFLFLDMIRGNHPLSQKSMLGLLSEDLPYELVTVAQLIRERLTHAAKQLAWILTKNQADYQEE
jgi:hypothetical protein